MQVVEGRSVTSMGAGAFDDLAASFDRVVVDVGTGDGLFCYHLAAADPTTLYVGCDPVAGNMAEVARRSRRKPARGGVGNLLLVVATAEAPPDELRGRAAEVYCVLPWGRLLAGIVTGDAEVLGGLRAVARSGAPVHVYLNAGVWDRRTPLDVQDLPELTPDYVEGTLVPAYAACGLTVTEHADAPPAEVNALRSKWARRLTHGGGGRFVRLEAVAC